MSWGWCGRCGGELISCECEELIDDDDCNYDADADDYEVVNDSQVVMEYNSDGAMRIVVL